jgi:hypothetical protein
MFRHTLGNYPLQVNYHQTFTARVMSKYLNINVRFLKRTQMTLCPLHPPLSAYAGHESHLLLSSVFRTPNYAEGKFGLCN